jgi:dTDP-glucose 4,6-dehydratase
LIIANAREGAPLLIYGDGLPECDWLLMGDHSRAISLAMEQGTPGSVYNVSAGTPRPNLEVVRKIPELMGKPESLIQ